MPKKKTDTVTIPRDVYDILVAAYKAHEAGLHASWARSEVPMLTPTQVDELDQA